jgi:hypothetical protein
MTNRIQLKTKVVGSILALLDPTEMLHLKLTVALENAGHLNRKFIRVRMDAEDHERIMEALRALDATESPDPAITEAFHRSLCIKYPSQAVKSTLTLPVESAILVA